MNESNSITKYWITPDDEFVEVKKGHHVDYVERNLNEFFSQNQIDEFLEKERYLDQGDWNRLLIKKAQENGAVRVTYGIGEVFVHGEKDEITESLMDIVTDNPDTQYRVDVTDKNTSGIYDLEEFMQEFSKSRKRKRRKSKISRFREIIREEIQNLLSEINYDLTGAYWIGPEGRVESSNNHYPIIKNDPEWFGLSNELFEKLKGKPNYVVENILEETEKINEIYKDGFVRIRKHGSDIYISGERSAIKDKVDEIMFDHSEASYTIDVFENGKFKHSYSDLNTGEFIEKFSGRKKSRKSKVTKFR